MDRSNIIEILKSLMSGNVSLDELSETIDEWLFTLRQKPDLTPEQEMLSVLELYIHEVKEGYRSLDELYEYVLFILERDISEQNSTTIVLNNTEAISEFITITRGVPVKDYHLELALV
jgi:hypothetical protein